jgi:polyvinyl alcohol dehydrogenase (cytochrome)
LGGRRVRTAVAAAVLLIGSALVVSAQAVDPPCSIATPAGGDWPTYGGDLVNSRRQVGEHRIGPVEAATLSPAWTFSAADAGHGGVPPLDASAPGIPGTIGAINSPPIVANGCLFFGLWDGAVFALDAATGKVVWKNKVDVGIPGPGGAIVGSASVVGDKIIYLVNESANGSGSGPFAVAFDKQTGAVVWESAPVSIYPDAYTNASPVVFNGMLFFGYSPPEGDSQGQGGWAILSAATGAILKITETIPPADQGVYAGGGMWATPAFDAATRHAFIGSGNPFSKQVEHRYINSILKIDMDPGRPTFGEIVAYYKGNVDQYQEPLTVLRETPACAATRDFQAFFDNPVCGQLDLDFGASPNLFRDSSGRRVIGELQKSGIYHAVYADTMTKAWTATVGLPCFPCNSSSSAFDGSRIAVAGTPGGVLAALRREGGGYAWVQPILDVLHYESVSIANGVVYAPDSHGLLNAFEAATGLPVLKRPMALDVGEPVFGLLESSGAVIAEGKVFVSTTGLSGGWIIAYQ